MRSDHHIALNIRDEFAPLTQVVLGRAEGYHRNPERVEVVNATQARTAEDQGHPTEAELIPEFKAFQDAMTRHGVSVHIPDLAPGSVQDQTCPRDIGFVIGETFVRAGMRHASRIEEIEGIEPLLARTQGRMVPVPDGIALEGGDVIVAGPRVYVGHGQRSDIEGAAFLAARFGTDWEIVPIPTRWGQTDADVLHLDCTFNPLGLGHALIFPDGMAEIPVAIREEYQWLEVTFAESCALATNVLSIAPDTVLARDHPDCARVNGLLRKAGYTVIELGFDAVPGTGGSFRCATLPLERPGD